MDLNIAIFGAGGFIGTNLTKVLSENERIRREIYRIGPE